MNITKIKQLREFISELPPQACNMTDWLNRAWANENHTSLVTPEQMKQRGFSCGTVGCIGGWATVMAQLEGEHQPIIARLYLGLTDDEADILFHSYPRFRGTEFPWKTWMLERLDEIIESGKIKRGVEGTNGSYYN